MATHWRMLIGVGTGLVLGLLIRIGAASASPAARESIDWLTTNVVQTLGVLWLHLLFVLVIPLIFSALVMGIADLDLKQIGRVGLKMLGYTVVVSTVAVLIGMSLVNLIGPGRGIPAAVVRELREGEPPAAAAAARDIEPLELVRALIPDNVIGSAAKGDMIGVIVFSLLFGIGVAVTKTEATRRLREAIQGVYDVSMRLIDMVLWLAPIGVGALFFVMVLKLGTDVLGHIAAYVGVVLLGLGLHMFVVYSLAVYGLAGMHPVAFFKHVRLAMLTAFSTASSNATLPVALEVAHDELRLPQHVSRFVLTAGSTMNQNGTALFEGVTVLFLAQVFHVELTGVEQVIVMGICILAGIGTAGVPAGSLPVIAMILLMFGIPAEGLALILGVDRLLDMCRTTLNVTGDLAAAVVIAKGEGASISGARTSADS